MRKSIFRAGRKPEGRITVRFEFWLLVVSGMVNAIAAVSSAISAWYSSNQAVVARDSINLTYKNDAFSKFLANYDEFCRVSLRSSFDDDLSATLIDKKGFDVGFLMSVNFDRLPKDITTEELEDFNKKLHIARSKLESSYGLLRIWLTEQEDSAIGNSFPRGEEITDFFRYFDKNYLPIYLRVREFNFECHFNYGEIIYYYRSDNKNYNLAIQLVSGIMLSPFSREMTAREILTRWNQSENIKFLSAYQPDLLDQKWTPEDSESNIKPGNGDSK